MEFLYNPLDNSEILSIFGILYMATNKLLMLRTLFSFALLLLAVLSIARVPTGEARFDKMTPKFAAYVRTYADLAMEEHVRFGVPASVTLAQGILESAAGTSDHVSKANNHFGIKAKKGNELFEQLAIGKVKFSEGNFAKYSSAWWCFRHHSKLLTNGSYAHIKGLSGNNYKAWIFRIKKAGYAEDPLYVGKIISLIDQYELWRYDGHRAPVASINTKV